MNKKFVLVRMYGPVHTVNYDIRELLSRLEYAGIKIESFNRYGRIIKTSYVTIRIITRNSILDGLSADEVFGFDERLEWMLRKNHSKEGFKGSLIDYILKEEKEHKTMKEITRELTAKITGIYSNLTDEKIELMLARGKTEESRQKYAESIKNDLKADHVEVTKIKDFPNEEKNELTREISAKITYIQKMSDADADIVIATANEKVVTDTYAYHIKKDTKTDHVEVTKIKVFVIDAEE